MMQLLKRRPTEPGGLVPSDVQANLKNQRAIKHLANEKANANRWFSVAVGSLVMTAWAMFGWWQADKRFAENVRVAYVKLDPSGSYRVQYDNEGSEIDYFTSTVESKLSEFVEKRYSKRRETISTDYGFAYLMMSPDLQAEFMEKDQAAKTAAAVAACKECDQETVKIRNIESIDKDLVPGSKRRQQYNTLIFTTVQTRATSGKVQCANKIVTLIWRFRPMQDIVSKKNELRYNPLGQEVIRSTMRDDPTKVTEQECRSL